LQAISPDQHVAGIDDHLAFGEYLRQSGRNDPTTVGWGITALFYSAIHAVRGYLQANHRERVSSHNDMRRFYDKYPELRKTKDEYDELKQQSQSARYYLNPNFDWSDYDELKKSALKIQDAWQELTLMAIGTKLGVASR
jgi:hypothetical protein